MLADQQLPATLAGDLIVYVIFPLIVIAIVGAISWARGLNRRLNTQDKALALLVQQVMPEGQPSLRDVVTQHSSELAFIKGSMTTGGHA